MNFLAFLSLKEKCTTKANGAKVFLMVKAEFTLPTDASLKDGSTWEKLRAKTTFSSTPTVPFIVVHLKIQKNRAMESCIFTTASNTLDLGSITNPMDRTALRRIPMAVSMLVILLRVLSKERGNIFGLMVKYILATSKTATWREEALWKRELTLTLRVSFLKIKNKAEVLWSFHMEIMRDCSFMDWWMDKELSDGKMARFIREAFITVKCTAKAPSHFLMEELLSVNGNKARISKFTKLVQTIEYDFFIL